jgi:hypothetical protein
MMAQLKEKIHIRGKKCEGIQILTFFHSTGKLGTLNRSSTPQITLFQNVKK